MSARVATLGLNPSRQEFLNRKGKLLRGPERRFATLEALGVESLQHAPVDIIEVVLMPSDST